MIGMKATRTIIDVRTTMANRSLVQGTIQWSVVDLSVTSEDAERIGFDLLYAKMVRSGVSGSAGKGYLHMLTRIEGCKWLRIVVGR